MKSLVDPFSKPGHVIRRLQQYAVLIFHEETAGFDLTPTQYVTLQVLEHRPGIDQVTLSELTAIDRSMTARIVDALAQRGLIDKRPAANDRRANSLFITAKARRLLAAIEAKCRPFAGQDPGAAAPGRTASVHAFGENITRRVYEAAQCATAFVLRVATLTPPAPRSRRRRPAPGRS